MLILITGVPGTGKTTIAKDLAERLNYKYVSEKDLLTKEMYEEVNYQGDKLKDVDISLFEKKAKSLKGNLVLDGLLFPEINMNFDFVVILYEKEATLRKRLKERGYSEAKIEDNIFVQNQDYFLDLLDKQKHVLILPRKSIKRDVNVIIKWLKKHYDF